MVNEGGSVWFQHSGNFLEICLQYVRFHVNQRIKTEHKINRSIFCYWNRPAVILNDLHVRKIGKAPLAMFDTLRGEVHRDQTVAMLLKKFRPAAKAWSNFQCRLGGQVRLDS